MPTIMCLCFAFLSIYSSSGKSAGISGVLRTTVRKMCWHLSQTMVLLLRFGRLVLTKSMMFWHKFVYISVYWCCLLDASKMSASRSSNTCLYSSRVTSVSSVSTGSVARRSAQSLSYFSGVNLLMIPRHCCFGPAFFFRTLRVLDVFFTASSSFCFRALFSPAALLHESLLPSLESEDLLQDRLDLHEGVSSFPCFPALVLESSWL
mmetsp:Transcript_84580/g.159400  ORF Transcript_84580/g.159400 Transcript_84580/m.159400 type:complete len:206 (+) Transcript_84580:553-1170(+)